MEQKILNFFSKHRLLDGYIGILGIVLHYRILANYSGWFYLFYVSLRNIISLNLSYHPKPSKYPRLQFALSLFEKKIVDNGEVAAKKISDDVDNWLADEKKKKQAARNRIEPIDPEAASFI